MKKRQKVITLTTSKHWHSIISQQFDQQVRIDVLDLDDAQHECQKWPGSAVVIELTNSTVLAVCQHVARQSGGRMAANQVARFAVGEPWLVPWRPILATAGFAATCVTPAEASRLTYRISRHWQSAMLPDQDIETRWAHSLPWKSAQAFDSTTKDSTFKLTRFSNNQAPADDPSQG